MAKKTQHNENQLSLFDEEQIEQMEKRIDEINSYLLENNIEKTDENIDISIEELTYAHIKRTRQSANNFKKTSIEKNNRSHSGHEFYNTDGVENPRQMVHKHSTNDVISGNVRERENAITIPIRTTGDGVENPNENGEHGVIKKRSNEFRNIENGGSTNEFNQGDASLDNIEEIQLTNYSIPQDYNGRSQSPKEKFKLNIEAIKTLKLIESENRNATEEEKGILFKYNGWGGLPQVYDSFNKKWESEYKQTLSLLDDDEYIQARRSTQDAHYTPKEIINSIYFALNKMGFKGGDILEPSAGIGNFIGLMPNEMMNNSNIFNIEMDDITFRILNKLYPNCINRNSPFQNVNIPNDSIDVVIGNPPFGSQKVYDENNLEASKFSIHNYFISKSIDKLKDNGILAMVISHHFLDSKNSSHREYISERANFIGAIRLPTHAFKNALTEVTTDIVFFQKTNDPENNNKNWLSTYEFFDIENGDTVPVNDYFLDNPANIIGNFKVSHIPHKTLEVVSKIDNDKLEEEILGRLSFIPENIYKPSEKIKNEDHENNLLPKLDLSNYKVGSYFSLPDNSVGLKITENSFNSNDYKLITFKNDKEKERMLGMIKIRDEAKELLSAQINPSTDSTDIQIKIKDFNKTYDNFVRKYGFLNSRTNSSLIKADTESALIFSLEKNYDNGISKELAKKNGVDAIPATAEKSDIFKKRVIQPRKNITHADSSIDALNICINKYGKVDLSYIEKLVNKPTDEIVNDLKGIIYKNPANNEWETASKYLSGNVKEKLRIAKEQVTENEYYKNNILELEKIIPADIDSVDISFQLGSTWIDDKYVNDFIKSILGRFYGKVTYIKDIGTWHCELSCYNLTENSFTYGTQYYSATELITAILKNKTIVVKDQNPDPKGYPIVNEEKTAAALQKAEEIKTAFQEWLWEDDNRREYLTRKYNDIFNCYVPPVYKETYLNLENTSSDIKLRENQITAIYRGIEQGSLLMDHCVGAGKTFEFIATAMESKRMGLANKPMIVVPNHLLAQWSDDFRKLYPDANVLIATEDDFAKKNRHLLFSKIAMNDWDSIVIGHSSLKKIPLPKDTLNEIINEEVINITSAIANTKKTDNASSTRIVKQLEKTKDRLQAKMEKQAQSGDKDDLLTFEQLGVDQLYVDELQEFKNLAISTSLNVSGLGNVRGSDKAFDLFVKIRYLQNKYNGKGFYAGTGTPLSNSITEVYTLQRYCQYDELKRLGIHYFDTWASTFGQIQANFELDTTGQNYKLVNRFSKFQNVPELSNMYKQFSDTILLKDLKKQAESIGLKFPVPKIKGGKPENVISERSEKQAIYIESIIERMENPKDKKNDNMLKITSDARKVALDYRMIEENTPDFKNSKINILVDKVYNIYVKNNYRKGTQLIFSDLSTPKAHSKNKDINITIDNCDETNNQIIDENDNEDAINLFDFIDSNSSNFCAYDDIKNKLIAKGVPEHEIAFIHSANTTIRKGKLYEQVNNGDIRILLGSTSKMGAGTNVQKRLVAVHHLDCPWRPSDLEQREGRIIRQGNMFYEQDPDNFEIEILRYATKQTYDSRMWQTIEIKANSIEQFRQGNMVQRVIEDISGESANAAEMKAAASGNPLILTQINLSTELKKMEAIYKNFTRNKIKLQNDIVSFTKKLNEREQKENEIKSNIYIRNSKPDFVFSTNGIFLSKKKEDFAKIGKLVVDTVALTKSSRKLENIGNYRGFNLKVQYFQLHSSGSSISFYLQNPENNKLITNDNLRYFPEDKLSLSGLFTRIENTMSNFDGDLKKVIEYFDHLDNEIKKMQIEVKKEFESLSTLKALRLDNSQVISEIKKMSSEPNYNSNWKPTYKNAADQVVEKKPLLLKN